MPRPSRSSLLRCTLLLAAALALAVPALPAAGDDFLFLRDFVTVGDRVVFRATSSGGNGEPWVSDGTAAGTFQLADLCPGPCSVDLRLVPAGADALFLVSTQPSPQPSQIWHSDGTPAGTVPLLPPGLELFADTPLALVDGLLYFSSCPGLASCRLWRSDGTPGGTEEVPGLPASRSAFEFAVADGDVYFATRTESGAATLWRTDGPQGAPIRIRDFAHPVAQPTAFGGEVSFLVRNESTLRTQLWASDGTAAGTRPVRPLPGVGLWLRALGPSLYLGVENTAQALWQSDGTEAGTRRLSARFDPSGWALLPRLEAVGGRLYFEAEGRSGQFELWSVADGPYSTRLLGTTAPFRSHPVRLGDRLLFSLGSEELGSELWLADAQGARPLFDLCPGRCNGLLSGPAAADGRAYFVAETPRFGRQLWSTDGTAGGTRRLTRFSAGTPGAEVGVAGDSVFFARYGTGSPETTELWVSGGRRGTARFVAEIRPEPPALP